MGSGSEEDTSGLHQSTFMPCHLQQSHLPRYLLPAMCTVCTCVIEQVALRAAHVAVSLCVELAADVNLLDVDVEIDETRLLQHGGGKAILTTRRPREEVEKFDAARSGACHTWLRRW